MILDRRITIQQLTESQDNSGGMIHTWATFYECNSGFKDSSGTERMESDRDTATRRTEFWIRYNPDYIPTEKMRISYDGGNYDIEAVISVGRKYMFKLMCELKDE